MSARCAQELCPMWDGDTCPCESFGIDPENPPTRGIFTTTWPQHADQQTPGAAPRN